MLHWKYSQVPGKSLGGDRRKKKSKMENGKDPLSFEMRIFRKCQPIPIFLFAYLVPLDVDVVPIKFHQFLFGK